jgi:hypothetical protein
MPWLLLTILAWLWQALVFAQVHPMPGPGTKGVGAPTCADDFNRANGGLGTNWSTTTGLVAMAINTNAVTGVAGSDGMQFWNVQSLGTDHFSQVVLTTVAPVNENLGPCVRVDAAGNGYCYYAAFNNERALYRINAGAFTLLVSVTTTTNTTNDVLRLAVSGTGATVALTMKRNGALDTVFGGGTGVVNDTNAARLVSQVRAGLGGFGAAGRIDTFACGTGA